MNYNYSGSLAERFSQLATGLSAQNDIVVELFNNHVIYMPSTLAAANLVGVDIAGIKDAPVVVKVDVDTYADLLKGDILAQWQPIFRQDSNFDVTLYVVVFYVPDGSGLDVFSDHLTVGALSIDYSYLTTAFGLTKIGGFWKSLFSPSYDATDANFFDLSLCLAYLCKLDVGMSFNLSFLKLAYPLEVVDTNPCKIGSKTKAEEIAAATALNVVIAGVTDPRIDYYWGMLNLIQALNTWVVAHSEMVYLFPIIFAEWFAARNAAKVYVGNKLEKQRLSGSNIKPTGYPSILDSSVNVNLPLAQATILEDKFVSFLMSVGDDASNDSVILRAKSVTGYPVTATAIAKIIDYDTSQAIAKMMVAQDSVNKPVLKNDDTYKKIQNMLLSNIQRFAVVGRLTEIDTGFPAYADLPVSKTDIVVSAAWKATYVYDLEKVQISGSVTV